MCRESGEQSGQQQQLQGCLSGGGAVVSALTVAATGNLMDHGRAAARLQCSACSGSVPTSFLLSGGDINQAGGLLHQGIWYAYADPSGVCGLLRVVWLPVAKPG